MGESTTGSAASGSPVQQSNPTPTTSNPPPSGNGLPTTADEALQKLKEKLESFQKDFDKTQEAVAQQKTRADELKADVAVVDKSYQEIDKALMEYEQVYEDIRCEIEKHKKYADEVSGNFNSLSDKSTIDKYWSDVTGAGGKFDSLKTKINNLNAKEAVMPAGDATVQAAQNEHANKAADLEQKQKAYDDKKSEVASLQKSLKELAGLQKSINENLNDKKKIAYVYFLDYEVKRLDIQNKFETYKQNPLSKTLFQAWQDLLNAREAAREAEKSINQKTEKLAKKQKELTALEKSYMNDIIEMVHAIAS